MNRVIVSLLMLVGTLAVVTVGQIAVAPSASATTEIVASQGDNCGNPTINHNFDCTPGYTGTSGGTSDATGWPATIYGGKWADAHGHNCTMYVAWRLQQEGMGTAVPAPGSWGNADEWGIPGAHGDGSSGLTPDSNPTVGSVAWFGNRDHVAFVEQVGTSQNGHSGYVFVRADNFISSSPYGYTDAGWVLVSNITSNGGFLHPYPAGEGKANAPKVVSSGPVDFNGDGVSDYVNYANGQWAVKSGSTGTYISQGISLGDATCTPVVGDFNGDGISDYAVDCGGQWAVKDGKTNAYIAQGIALGDPSCTPLVGDFNGDGTSDYVTYCGGQWAVKSGSTGTYISQGISLGDATCTPLVGDFNGDGISDYAVDCGGQWAVKDGKTNAYIAQGITLGDNSSIGFSGMPGDIAGSVAPTISGGSRVGSSLTASTGTWTPSPTSYAYQWFADGSAVSGATSGTFTPPASIVGKTLTVQVTATRKSYKSASATSAGVVVQAGTLSNSISPAISGAPSIGSTLSSSTGTWSQSGTSYAYQWLANGTAISGATASTYAPAAGDVGKTITVQVTASKTGYSSASATSAGVVVQAGTLTNTAVPTITGTPCVGVKLTATAGSWSPVATYGYQWLANGTAISGATASTYTPTAGVKGKQISVRVAASKAGYTTASATSSQTAVVAAGIIANKTLPTITGTKTVGHTLTASAGTWSVSGLTVKYQWLRDGKVISGATAKTYKLTAASKGHRISIKVTVSRTGYTTASKASASTTKIT